VLQLRRPDISGMGNALRIMPCCWPNGSDSPESNASTCIIRHCCTTLDS
jgi:hypothetical protein